MYIEKKRVWLLVYFVGSKIKYFTQHCADDMIDATIFFKST